MSARSHLNRSVSYVLLLLVLAASRIPHAAHALDLVRPLNPPPSNRDGFERLAPDDLGLHFEKGSINDPGRIPIHITNTGLCAGDMDGDELCDLFVCRLDGSSALFRNLGNWQFKNVTKESGLNIANRSFFGSTFADIDGDNDLDLILLSTVENSALFLNDGSGNFAQDTSMPWFRSPEGGDVSAAVADIDGDNDLDIYVAGYRTQLLRNTIPREEYNALMAENRQRLKEGRDPIPSFAERFDIIKDKNSSATEFRIEEKGIADRIYINQGNGRFLAEEVSGFRFRDENGFPTRAIKDWSLAAMFQDVDGDGDSDLYVCNDFLSPDRFWINDGTGNFKMIDSLAVRRTSWFSMGVDFSDLNHDGIQDVFVVDMLSRSHARRKRQMGEMTPSPIVIGSIDNRPQIMQNTLLLSRADGSYTEIGQFAGVKASDWSWCPIFLDVDLDGHDDILVSNGREYDTMDADTALEMRKLGGSVSREMFGRLYPRLETPNVIFRNRGDLTFEDKSRDWGFTLGAFSGGMVLADLDNDGDMDVVVANAPEFPLGVYRNRTSAPRIAVRLRGSAPNTHGIGARIRLLGGTHELSRQVIAGGAYASGSDTLRAFAAPEADAAYSIHVHWPGGHTSIVENARPNRLYVIDESDASLPSPSAEASPAENAQPIFEDVTRLLGHSHPESPFDDFKLQPLLPNRLSQLGPGVAWFDVDNDRDDDLILASGSGGNIHVLVNDGSSGFTDFKSPRLHMETTAALGFINHQGDATLFAGMASYESDGARHPSAQGFYFKEGKRWHLQDGLPHFESSTGPVSLGDVDGDGDLDLFVGGRVIPGRYPAPASSRLFLYDKGKWLPSPKNSNAFNEVGLVSGAAFGDIDGDGDADLALALEWDSPKVFLNDDGTLHDASAKLGLSGYKGWWNGVAMGDFNNDGRLDLVVSNWGLNSKYEHSYSLLKPLQIYHGDLDGIGAWDVVEAHFDKRMNTLVPERGRSCSSRAMPFVAHRNASYAQFGSRGLHEVYGDCLKQADVVEANTLAHMVFLNRGDRLVGRQLPRQAQLAPGFHVGVADFDGDGAEDVFMSQNFFAVQVETPRNDGGRSLWLKGDGKGGFSAVPGHLSGVIVHGEARGAAVSDFDRDGRVDLVVTQNGAQTRLFRNRGGRRGLRVRLAGPPANPLGIGAAVRLHFGKRPGPARLLAAGSGYWSQDSATVVLGTPRPPSAIEVRWPDGKIVKSNIPDDAGEIVVDQAGSVTETLSGTSEN